MQDIEFGEQSAQLIYDLRRPKTHQMQMWFVHWCGRDQHYRDTRSCRDGSVKHQNPRGEGQRVVQGKSMGMESSAGFTSCLSLCLDVGRLLDFWAQLSICKIRMSSPLAGLSWGLNEVMYEKVLVPRTIAGMQEMVATSVIKWPKFKNLNKKIMCLF